MSLIDWQFYWPKWGLGWRDFHDEEFGIIDRVVVVGPLQMQFRRMDHRRG